jgi:hypothetical protein
MSDKEDESKIALRNLLLGLAAGMIALAYVAGAARGWKTRSLAGRIGKKAANVGSSIKQAIPFNS